MDRDKQIKSLNLFRIVSRHKNENFHYLAWWKSKKVIPRNTIADLILSWWWD